MNTLALGNSRAINATIAAIYDERYTMIQECKIAKAAWDTLQIAFEGTNKVKVNVNKLHMITSGFEALQMQNDETIAEYHKKVKDMENEVASLEEPMSQKKILRKLLRLLPSLFDRKIYAIKDAHDITTILL